MKAIINNTSDAAREVLLSVPPIVLFMGGVVGVLALGGMKLAAMLAASGVS
tara:strand:+ start:7822 stop:7974 length:153 start_codon:yes stop_codon:yes gene_type:complete